MNNHLGLNLTKVKLPLFNRLPTILLGMLCLVFMLCGAGCDDNDTPTPIVCDCSADPTGPITEIESIVIRTTKGYYLLSPYKGFLNICNPLDSSLRQDGLMILASGQLKSTCEMPNEYPGIQENFVTLENWKVPDDSLFAQLPGVEIRIIRSEDYGVPPGFGYYVTVGGMKILQPHLPAVGGNQPFKTRVDAFKIAVLVAYKLKAGLHPAIAVNDLVFFKII